MIFRILGLLFLIAGIYLVATDSLFQAAAYTFIPLGAVFLGLGIFMGGRAKTHARLMTSGVAGTATIREATQTNMELNNQPVVSLTLDISAPGHASYTATTKTAVPIVILSQVRLVPGATLPVKVDPAKPESFIIDWAGAVAQQASDAARATAT